MLDINIAYPEFVPNQILTDRQLNQLHAHLEQEDRSTRLRLAGRGIICGLHARKVADTVEIDAGYGVTSDGDLIELCEQARTTYTHFRPYVDPDLDEDKNVKYVPWRSDSAPTQQFNIVELLPKEAMEAPDETQRPKGATKLTADHLDPGHADSKVAGRVLVLYLEHQPVELKSCLVTSCDNKGRNINVHVRALLVKRSDLPAATLVKDCRPVSTFPRHLMLGVLDGSSAAGRRHEFSPSPLREVLQADLRTDVEQEDRSTRLRLAGVGIACGLHARKVSTPAPAIEIDAGYGVTSD
ncbi:MAG: hypothetical protein HYY76_02620, partial [Acidobacteria bacterium]|nr:hypothetical protein [Acidobacteriota bacterium]